MRLSTGFIRHGIFVAAIVVPFAAIPRALTAQSLIPPLGSINDRLSADDLNRMSAAAARLYQERSIGTVERWRNPDSKNAGSVKLLRRFETKGMPCWRMEYTIRFEETKEHPHQYLVNWCKTTNGEWKLLEHTPHA